MGLWDWFRGEPQQKQIRASKPREMVFRFLPNGQVTWYEANGEEYLEKGYLGNHAVFTIVDWIAKKVASAPPILYEVKDEKSFRRYNLLQKEATPESLFHAGIMKRKALEEVDGGEMMNLFDQPNELMSWFELCYGHIVYKLIVGSSYWTGSRDGIEDATTGKIREIWLPPAHQMNIVSGGVYEPIDEYYLSSNPEVRIDKANVMQIRNFSPNYDTPTQWMYGLSKLHAARTILQEYNEGVEAKVDIFQKRGIRDIVFPKKEDWGEEDMAMARDAQDNLNRKILQSGPNGIAVNGVELGAIRVGLSPDEMGILDSQKLTKQDFCALFHVPAILFGWSDQTTYNNLSESRKIALTDAVLPELESLKQGLNNWLVPSWFPSEGFEKKRRRYMLDFDYEYFSELQEDVKETVKWMNESGCLTTNEKRAAIRYDAAPDENADKVLVNSNVKLLETIGTDSFEIDPRENWEDGEERGGRGDSNSRSSEDA